MDVISSYSVHDAIADGTHIDVTDRCAHLFMTGDGTPVDDMGHVKPLHLIESMDDYLRSYGKILGRKAINALTPLHVPDRDGLPDFDDLLREPFDPQKHVIAAAIKMLDVNGSGFIVGEMGTGKTLIGMVSVQKHAHRSRKQGGKGGKYRSLVLCPDHLISKWCRELTETIPGAIVRRFGPQPVAEDDEPEEEDGFGRKPKAKARKKGKKNDDTGTRATLRDFIALLGLGTKNHRWVKPEGPEWYVLGRNQAKWMSDWIGLADEKRSFSGETVAAPMKNVVVKKEPVVNDKGQPVYDRTGRQKMKAITFPVFTCPRCGTVAADHRGTPLGEKDLQKKAKNSSQKRCRGTYAVEITESEKRKGDGLDLLCPNPLPEKRPADKKTGRPADEFNRGGRRYRVMACNEPLYNYTSRPYRWAPAKIVQKKLRRFFQYLVVDEVHEQKSDESAQSMACGKLIASVNHVIALTGTIIGGYAHHLFPLMMRITPDSLKHEGFEWGRETDFAEAYGRIDRIVTTTEKDPVVNVSGNVKSMRRAKSGDSRERRAIRPGVMPTMFGKHMLGSSMFITLEELADELPDLFEYIGGPFVPSGDRDRDDRAMAGYHETAIEMEDEQRVEYNRVNGVLEMANRDLLRKGSMKLLGAYLWTTMDYPDRPYGWGDDPELLKAFEEYKAEVRDTYGDEKADALKLPHTVGFWDQPGSKKFDNWVGVVTPKDCDHAKVYPKEQALIDICEQQKKDGRQTWVYVNMTGKRNVQPRLKMLLEREGLRVGILKAGDVDPKEREDWIIANGRNYDVMISHPQLVSTGLDLFSKQDGGHNYATLVFYQTGYNLFTMRQAARRAWRIGQPLDCRVYYLYYRETMQHRAMQLMSRKMAAAQALEGEFSEDGLAAMAGEDNLQMALAKSLADRIDSADMQRSWNKVKSSKKAKPVKPTPKIADPAAEPEPAPTPPAPTGRIEWPMPRIADLATVTDAMLGAFRKLASRPDDHWNRKSLGCIQQTIDKLVNLGLAEPSGLDGHVRCKHVGKTLARICTWFRLYGTGFGIYLPLGVVIAEHPEKGKHYVKVVNHQHLSKGVEFIPMDSFPWGQSIPYCAYQEELKAWRLVEASDEDRETLAAAGLFKWAQKTAKPSKLDDLAPEAQLLAEAMLDAQSKPVDPTVAADYAEVADRVAASHAGKVDRIPDPDEAEEEEALRLFDPDHEEEIEIPELTEEILAKMFANMMTNNAW